VFNSTKFASIVILLALAVTLVLAPVASAQDMSAPVVCDSTLVTLLLVAEHNYDYLTNMDMEGHMPNLDLGQYQPMIHQIMARMTDMQNQMSNDQAMMMATEEAMMSDMMGMSDQDVMNQWMQSMGMDSSSGDNMSMTMLAPGDVAGEDPACTALRADVQHFLLVHVIGDMMMKDSSGM